MPAHVRRWRLRGLFGELPHGAEAAKRALRPVVVVEACEAVEELVEGLAAVLQAVDGVKFIAPGAGAAFDAAVQPGPRGDRTQGRRPLNSELPPDHVGGGFDLDAFILNGMPRSILSRKAAAHAAAARGSSPSMIRSRAGC